MFFYKKVTKGKQGTDEPDVISYDCINPSFIIRGVTIPDGRFVVLLNDGHEESRYIVGPRFNKEGKLLDEGKKSRDYVISEVELDAEDAARFRKLFEVEDYTRFEEMAEID